MATAAWYLCALVMGSSTLEADHTEHHASARGEPNIVEIATTNENFETLTAALGAAELVEAIRDARGITVLAPTDAAFGKLDQASLAATIERNPTGRLADILKFHVIPERLTAAELVRRRFVTTLDGQRLEINITGDGLAINNASIIAADIEAENGIIHAIDTVLIPAKPNIAATAAAAGTFTTLLAAVGEAGLADFVSSTDPLTVFAPTDEAFAALGEDTVASLLQPENRETLKQILSYHVIAGERVYGGDLFEASEIETASGDSIRSSVKDGSIFVNESRVVSANIDAANGVVHAIDRVLMPESLAVSAVSPLHQGDPAFGVLTLAIDRGVPLFNDHHPAACAAVYEVAIQSVLTLGSSLSTDQSNALRDALAEGRGERDARERAWIFRRGMDRLLPAAGGRSMTVVTVGRDH